MKDLLVIAGAMLQGAEVNPRRGELAAALFKVLGDCPISAPGDVQPVAKPKRISQRPSSDNATCRHKRYKGRERVEVHTWIRHPKHLCVDGTASMFSLSPLRVKCYRVIDTPVWHRPEANRVPSFPLGCSTSPCGDASLPPCPQHL